MRLSPTQKALHQRALDLSAQHRRIESLLITVLKEIDKSRLYRKLGQPSLFIYAIRLLGLTESVAYGFISVARKADEIAPLLEAIETRSLSVAKASRIVSALTKENARALIAFAQTHSTRETDFEVARLRPKTAGPDRVKPLSESLIKLELSISKTVFAKLSRARALVASKTGTDAGFEAVLDAVLTEYIERHDPVKRAARALAKKVTKPLDMTPPKNLPAGAAKSQPELCALRVRSRQPLTAAQKHSVFARDGGRCTHVDSAGARCETDRWLHLHQLSFPIEGQVTWLRESQSRYSA